MDLNVPQGEALGIIGSNGTGKNTLLKVIARVHRPTRGRVWVRGDFAPLIELGTGFHPELTGRENILLNGAMLGFSESQRKQKTTDIIRFAGLESFIDAPLRTYSSGMVFRLGFSIASDLNPDILVADEIMAVGDEAFQAKCCAHMESFGSRAATILLVSHNLATLDRLCDRVIWVEHGQIQLAGTANEVMDAYRERVKQQANTPPYSRSKLIAWPACFRRIRPTETSSEAARRDEGSIVNKSSLGKGETNI